MKRIQIGIVGLHWGNAVIDDLMSHDGYGCFDVTAVCDIDTERADTIAARHGVRAYYSIDDLLRNDGIPAIGLFTPPFGRSEIIEKIMAAGRDVMTTKPFELDAGKALGVLTKAREMGRVVHLNSPSPLLTPDLRQIRKWAAERNLGRMIACRCDTWASYREMPDGRWLDNPDLCPVAPIYRLGIYLINDLVRLFGEAKCVYAMHSRIFTGRPTPDNAQLGILFQNGAICNVFASFCIRDGQAYKNSLVLNFENGTVYRNIGPLPQDMTRSTSHMALMTKEGDCEATAETVALEGCSGQYEWADFHSALMGRCLEDEVTAEEIAEGIRVMNAAARAEKSGQMEMVR